MKQGSTETFWKVSSLVFFSGSQTTFISSLIQIRNFPEDYYKQFKVTLLYFCSPTSVLWLITFQEETGFFRRAATVKQETFTYIDRFDYIVTVNMRPEAILVFFFFTFTSKKGRISLVI